MKTVTANDILRTVALILLALIVVATAVIIIYNDQAGASPRDQYATIVPTSATVVLEKEGVIVTDNEDEVGSIVDISDDSIPA